MRLLGLALMLSLGAADLAFGKTDLGTERFSCDTPGGRYSRYQRPLDATVSRLSSIVHFNGLRDGNQWLPVVNVMLSGTTTTQRLGFRLIPNGPNKKTSIFAVFPGMKGAEALQVGEANFGSPIPLTINLSGQEAILSVNGKATKGVALDRASMNLDISCSSVDAHIDDILIGG